jgi:hypothetical protein
MHSIENNEPNAGCVEVIQVPLITPEEFAGMARMGGGYREPFTVAKVLYTPPVPKRWQDSQMLAAICLP